MDTRPYAFAIAMADERAAKRKAANRAGVAERDKSISRNKAEAARIDQAGAREEGAKIAASRRRQSQDNQALFLEGERVRGAARYEKQARARPPKMIDPPKDRGRER